MLTACSARDLPTLSNETSSSESQTSTNSPTNTTQVSERKIVYALYSESTESEHILGPNQLWMGHQLEKALNCKENEAAFFYVGLKLFYDIPLQYSDNEAVIRFQQFSEDKFLYNGKTLKELEYAASEMKKHHGDAMYGLPINITWSEYVGVMNMATEARKLYENEMQSIWDSEIRPLLLEFRKEEIARLSNMGFEFLSYENDIYAKATKEVIKSLTPTEDIGYGIWLEIPNLTDDYNQKVSKELAYELSKNDDEPLHVRVYTVWSNCVEGQTVTNSAELENELYSYPVPTTPSDWSDYTQYDSYEEYSRTVNLHVQTEKAYKDALAERHMTISNQLIPKISDFMNKFIARYQLEQDTVRINYDIQDGRVILDVSVLIKADRKTIMTLIGSDDVQFLIGDDYEYHDLTVDD